MHPAAAVTIVVEARRLVVRGCIVTPGPEVFTPPLCPAIRFLVIILASLGVRLVLEEGILPLALPYFGGDLIGASAVRSYGAVGLVVVPLLANLFWKPGLAKGLVQAGVTTGLTLVIMLWIVVPLINFDIAHLDATFEDVALDFSRSAKAEIMIVVGAALASWLTLRYGWDFGGILLPPLLALALLEPIRLAATVTEAVGAFVIGKLLHRVPPLNRLTLAGPRLTTYLFTIAVSIKIVVAWVESYVAPERAFTDLSGFGYIISALLAGKLWNKKASLTLFPTVLLTLLTFLVGSAIAFGAAFFVRALNPLPQVEAQGVPEHRLGLDLAILRSARYAPTPESARRDRRMQLAQGIGTTLDVLQHRLGVPTLSGRLDRLGVELTRFTSEDGTYVALSAPGGPATVLLRVDPDGAPLILLQHAEGGAAATPEGASSAAVAAAVLARRLRPRAVVLATPGEDPLWGVRQLLRAAPDWPVVEVAPGAQPALDVQGGLPDAFPPLEELRAVVPSLGVHTPGRLEGLRADLCHQAPGGVVSLRVDPGAADALAQRAGESPEPRVAYLHAFLHAEREQPPTAPPERQPWSVQDLTTLRRVLLRRVIAGGAVRLATAQLIARALDLQLVLLREPGQGGARYLVISDEDGVSGVDGALILALDQARGDLHVEVPNPHLHANTDQVGALIFLASGARSLTVAGVGNPEAGALPPDVASIRFRRTLFHLADEVLLELALEDDRRPPRILQVRGERAQPAAGQREHDGVLLGPDLLLPTVEDDRELVAPWLASFAHLGWKIGLEDPGAFSGYDLGITLQARYRRFLTLDDVSGVWVSTLLRRRLQIEPLTPDLENVLLGLGLPVERVALSDYLAREGIELGGHEPPGLDPTLEHVFRYQELRSVASLAAALALLPSGWSARVVEDLEAAALVVVLREEPRGRVVLINLLGAGGRGEPRDVDTFLRLRHRVLFGARRG
ncbi:MAG: poly-gamma-glutamate biosynthesis protein PgsC/CapC [Planctomycetota bacterium]